MRTLIMGGMLAASLSATPAPVRAQVSGDFAGLYTFQTTNYRTDGAVGVLSGVARATPLGGGWYDVRLYAIEYLNTSTGERRNTALQECEGRRNGPEIAITCTVVQSDATGYQPDNFTLRQVNAWQWDGGFTSSNSSNVTFVHFED